ncbi:sodium-coupled neutral amino acid symporter 1 [Alexandromys fortis]|uniref:sodium-coupled neutral amino acid symporter 1 n=1 Tax=Alexandromys fortis TaxID=100897 RepID=UPI002153720E|nr:sodium-coupled neutral amino acid symporter 1 [Microtus fortis]
MMHFKSGLELTELQNMTVPEDDNVSNDSNDFTEVENGQINSKFISDRESRRSLTNSHLEKRKCDEYIPGTTSLGMSVFNLSNAIMGSGILGLAFALANTGILLFLILLTSVTLLSIYSINLLLICSKETGCMVYEKLGEQVFGTTGKLVIFGATSLQNTGAMLSYLFIVKNELPSAIKFLMGKEEEFSAWYVDGRVLVVMVTFGIILPLCLLKNLGYLGYTSGFSLSCMVFFLIVVIYKKFQIQCMSVEQNSTISANVTDMCTPKYVTFNSKTVYALPTIAFAFVCHPSVLPIYSELKDRSQKKMQMVSNISFFAMFVMYFLTAIFGYLTFYGKLLPLVCTYLCLKTAGKTSTEKSLKSSAVVVMDSKHHGTQRRGQSVPLFLQGPEGSAGTFEITHVSLLQAALFLALGVLFSLISIPLVIYDWACSSSHDEGH